ncbi:MAG: hypothetical protein PHO48_02885 [Candidatus Gracilibacteria bacterium]|nr:hypothetical protein [Candidatus Gracilibacteria bacterium]MDD5179062.1 hypothetical protein [Candidatus Gracilibacteria bacterium]
MTTNKHSRETLKLASAGYIPLIGFLIFVKHYRNSFIAFHALQGIFLTLYLFLAYFLIPDFGGIISLIFVALAATGFIYTAGGKDYRIPLFSDFVEWLVKLFDKAEAAH